MATPQFATLAGLVKYSDGVTLLDGYALFLIAPPTGYTAVSVANQLIPQRIGDHVKVRIQAGVFDGSAHLYWNSSLEPPNSQYVVYYYDNNDVQLGHTGLFTVGSNPFTPAVPSFPVPTATAVVPSP